MIIKIGKKYFLLKITIIIFLFSLPLTSFALQVNLSSSTLEQADTLLVKVFNQTATVTGTFADKNINFFKKENTNDWIAIVGIDVKKKPGLFKLDVKTKDETFFQYVKVIKRNFNIGQLTIDTKMKKQGLTSKKIAHSIEHKSNPELYKILNAFNKKILFSQSFTTPLATTVTTGNFGVIRKNKGYTLQHLGVDLKAPMLSPINAVNSGKVVLSKYIPTYGNTLVIDHGLGIYSLYLHLNSFKAKNGEHVKQGSVIGFSGNTGYSTGAHLHFSMKVGGANVDPLRFIDATKLGI